MFSIELLPAQRGDCLWITYGSDTQPRHVLIDAGPSEAGPQLISDLRRRVADGVQLLVITHVDVDHIEGMVPLLKTPRVLKNLDEVWFNGYQHLAPALLGAIQGEEVSSQLRKIPKRWNAAFGQDAVARTDDGPLARVELPGGLSLIVLAPGRKALARLAPIWRQTCQAAGIVPGGRRRANKQGRRDGLLGMDIQKLAETPFRGDRSPSNATSIALVATYDGHSVLLAADIPVPEIQEGLRRLAIHGSTLIGDETSWQASPTGATPTNKMHTFDAIKMAHHGSQKNTSLDFCESVNCRYWLVSTNGASHQHPHPESLARVVVKQERPVFVFNYRSPYTDPWIALSENPRSGFETRYPAPGSAGIVHQIG